MSWRPNLKTIEDIGTFVEDLFDVTPEILGINEIIAGCEVLVIPAGALPKYIYVALGGDAGPPQTGYTQAVLYRGGITGLAVGQHVTVIHLREGNRYEVLGPGGVAGVAVDPAPVDAEYITMALDATLTDERVLTAGDGIGLVDGGAGGNATLSVDCSDLLGAWIGEDATNNIRFQPDLPMVISAGGVVIEYATIQAAITAAAACETVIVPSGTYNEDITLKNGVCVKGFGPRDKIRITGDVSIVTTASGGWLENVTIVMTDPPNVNANSAVHVVHNGTCNIRQITIIGTQSAARAIRGIGVTGAGTGILVADDIIIDISSAGNQAAYGVHFNLGSYELEMKNFKITVDNSNGGAAAWALGIVQGSSCVVKATEGWLDVTATGAGTAVDLSGAITYSEIINSDDYTIFGQCVGIGTAMPCDILHVEKINAGGNVNVFFDNPSSNVNSRAGLAIRLHDLGANLVSILFQGVLVDNTNGAAGTEMRLWNTQSGVLTQMVTIDKAGNIGMGITASIGANLHLQDANVAGAYNDSLAKMIIEGADTRLQLQSDNAGSQGSAVILSNNDRSWIIHHGAAGKSNRLDIGYRVSGASEDMPLLMSNYMTFLIGGNVGIVTTAPSRILDCNDGSGNMIADGYDNHPSWLNLKVDPTPMVDVLARFKRVVPYEYKRIPYVSADELARAAIVKFGQERWDIAFPDDYRGGKIRNIPDQEIREFVDSLADRLRAQRSKLPEWQRKHYGLAMDDLVDTFPGILSRNDEGEIDGYSLSNYVGLLHACITELVSRVEQLEIR